MEEKKELNNLEEKIAKVEAVMFVYGEPMSKEKILKIAKIDSGEIDEVISEFEKNLNNNSRGLMLLKKEDKFLLSTKPEFSEIIEGFIKEDLKEELSPASLETLSMVAYFAPISRVQIDFIRGVNSSFILRSLLIRGLVERKMGKGNMYFYEPTFDFLKYMGVDNISKLPDYDKYKKIKETYFANE